MPNHNSIIVFPIINTLDLSYFSFFGGIGMLYVRACVQELVARLDEFAEKGGAVDLQHWLR